MLEIFVVLAASRHIASMMKQKGRSPALFVALFVVLWFCGEILGAIFGVAMMSARHGPENESFKIVAYVCALLGALVGGAVGYLVAHVVPANENREESMTRGSDAAIPAILLETDDTPETDVRSDAIQAKSQRRARSWDEQRDRRDGSPKRRRQPEASTPVAVWIVVGVAALGIMLFLGGLASFVLLRDAPPAEIAPPFAEMQEDLPVPFDLPPPEAVKREIEPPLPAGALARLSMPQHAGGILAVGYSDDGKLLAVATSNERVYWFDAASRKMITQSVPRPKNVHGHKLSGAAVSPDAERVAFFGHGGLLFLVDRNNLALDFVLNPVGGAGTAQWKAAFSPDGKTLCTTHGDRLARVWSLEKREFAFSLGGFDQQVGSVAYSADGSLVACADDDILIFDGKSDALRATLKGPQPFFFHALAFAPDGKAIAGLHDRTVHYFKLRGDGEQLKAEGKAKLLHHLGRPRTIAFSPDGTLLLTGSDDGTLAVWNANSLERRGEKRLAGDVAAIAFRSTDGQLAVGSGEQVILFEQRALPD